MNKIRVQAKAQLFQESNFCKCPQARAQNCEYQEDEQ